MKTSELQGAALDWAVDKSMNLNTPYNSWGQIGKVPAYSTDWSQGGPIIEREGISVERWGSEWMAAMGELPDDGVPSPTPLIAAMRCYVASKLGDNTDIPEELK